MTVIKQTEIIYAQGGRRHLSLHCSLVATYHQLLLLLLLLLLLSIKAEDSLEQSKYLKTNLAVESVIRYVY